MRIEEYITLRKKQDGIDENNLKHKDETIRRLIDYIFDYYKILENEEKTSKITIQELRRKVRYQYEIENYNQNTQGWLLKIYSAHNLKIDRYIKKQLEDRELYLLISDTTEMERFSYNLFTDIEKKYKYMDEYPLEILEFIKDYHNICNREFGMAVSKYKLSIKAKKFIKNLYFDYNINLLAWSHHYLNLFFQRITLWPHSHRIAVENGGETVIRYDINASRNLFNLLSVFNKLDETIDVNAKIVRNKAYINELLKEISRLSFSDSCIIEAIK